MNTSLTGVTEFDALPTTLDFIPPQFCRVFVTAAGQGLLTCLPEEVPLLDEDGDQLDLYGYQPTEDAWVVTMTFHIGPHVFRFTHPFPVSAEFETGETAEDVAKVLFEMYDHAMAEDAAANAIRLYHDIAAAEMAATEEGEP